MYFLKSLNLNSNFGFEGLDFTLPERVFSDNFTGFNTISVVDFTEASKPVFPLFANITGTAGNDTLNGTAVADTIDGLAGDDIINGLGGNDQINGGVGADTVDAGDGDDIITDTEFAAPSDSDFYDGGAGNDTLIYTAPLSGSEVTFNILTGEQTIGGGTQLRDTFINIENLTLAGTVNAIGDGNDNILTATGFAVNMFEGGGGADTLDGGAGNDTLSYAGSGSGVTVNLGTGAASGGDADGDSFFNFENILGSAFADTLTGDANNNTIDGGAGDDQITGGGGTEQLIGGEGNDFISSSGIGSQASTLSGGDGSDTLFIGGDMLNGDIADGGAEGDVIAFATNYTASYSIDGGADVDLLSADNQAAALEIDLMAGRMNFVGSTDAFSESSITNIENIRGGSGNDILMGDGNDNRIEGDQGDDLIDGNGGNDTAVYIYAASAVTVSLNALGAAQNTGGAGTDTLISIENLTGSDFNDTLIGSVQDNILSGFLGDDILQGGQGNDILQGDQGSDTADFTLATLGVTVDLNIQGTAQNTWGADMDTLVSIENIYGSAHDDVIIGDAGDNVLHGGGFGADNIFGGDGNDELYGDQDDDLLEGGLGADILDGGTGIDTASYASSSERVFVALDGGTGSSGDADGDVLINIENLIGSAFSDSLSGDANDNQIDGGDDRDFLNGGDGNDTLNGDAGDDFLSGDAGVDILNGGAGGDTLEGGEGDDILNGGDGNDSLSGGLGLDTLSGGAGLDDFRFDLYADSGVGVNADVITDFALGDSVQVSEYLGVSRDAFINEILTFLGTGAFTAGGSPEFRYEKISGETLIQIDTNGDGIANSEIIIQSGEFDLRLTNDGVPRLEVDSAFTASSPDGDRVIGTNGNDVLNGSAMDDSLRGLSGDDTINAGAGDDFISGGSGNDIVDGGDGFDQLTYFGDAPVNLTITDTSVFDSVSGETDMVSNVERITHSQRLAAPSDDVMDASAATVIVGLYGGRGNDILIGGSGDDIIEGDIGTDTLTGGLGNDRFFFDYVAEIENDVITDFEVGDIIDFVSIQFVEGVMLTWIDTGTFSGVAGEFRSVASGGQTVFEFDIDGDEIADRFITLLGGEFTFVETQAGLPRFTILTEAASTGDDTIIGTNGDDVLDGFAGNDDIQGLAGDDIITGGEGADVMDGGAGSDTLSYAGSAAGVNANLNLGTFSGGDAAGDSAVNFENLLGSDFDDILIGDAGDNVIEGGAGADTMDAGGGNDTLSYAGSSAAVTADLGAGTLSGGDAAGDTASNFENLIGSAFDDALTGDGGNNALSGGDGDDLLNGGSGTNSLDGGAGNDTATYESFGLNATVDLTAGTASAAGSNLQVSSGTTTAAVLAAAEAGNLYINVGTGDNPSGEYRGQFDFILSDETDGAGVRTVEFSLFLNSGNVVPPLGSFFGFHNGTVTFTVDTMGTVTYAVSIAFNDEIDITSVTLNEAEAGVNGPIVEDVLADMGASLVVNDISDTLIGVENIISGSGNDTLTGDDAANLLDGMSGDDSLFGGLGDDTLLGGAGRDNLHGGVGADVLDGGDDFDTAFYLNSDAGVTVNLITGVATGGSAEGDVITNVENIRGSAFDDVLTTGMGGGNLEGGLGNDTLTGDDGVNVLVGGAIFDNGVFVGTGDDMLFAGGGDDQLLGGDGADYLDGGDGVDIAFYIASQAGVNINLTAGTATGGDAEGDTLVNIENLSGTNFDDVLIGDSADNRLSGSGGNDTLSGEGGNDDLRGGTGDDSVSGGAGDDTLTGGDGVNSLSGGTGADVFFVNALQDVTDTITDFEQIDTIELRGAADGTPALAFIGTALFNGVENEVRYEFSAGTTIIQIDTDGDMVADDTITLSGGEFALSAAIVMDGLDLSAPSAPIIIDGTPGDDNPLIGTPNDDVINGLAGNDVIDGLAGDDILNGDDGDDIFIVGLGNDMVNGGNGQDLLSFVNATAGINISNLDDGAFIDASAVGLGTETINSIEGLIGSAFDDFIFFSPSTLDVRSLYFDGGDGDDFIRAGNGDDEVYGGAGNDNLRGNGGDDMLFGGDGDDFMRSDGGVDTFDGGAGFDRISFFNLDATQGVIADLRTGVISNDGFGNMETFTSIEGLGGGTAYVDLFDGDDNDNLLLGAGFGDIINGHGGDDRVQVDSGGTYDGGAGTDDLVMPFDQRIIADTDSDGFAEFESQTTGVIIDLQSGIISDDGYGGMGTAINFENVFSGIFNDTLYGTSGANEMGGGDGNDSLDGRDGDDTLTGGLGDDILIGGFGADIIDGGEGTDLATYTDSFAGVVINLAAGTASGGDAQGDVLTNIEDLAGSLFDDTLTGDGNVNNIFGQDGNDIIQTGAGIDSVDAGQGNDTVIWDGANGDFEAGESYDGGVGVDTIIVSGATFFGGWNPIPGTILVNLALGEIRDITDTTVLATAVNFENYDGSATTSGVEVIVGTTFENIITTAASSQAFVFGLDGNDTLTTGAGDDQITGGEGADTMDGGAGIDELSYNNDASTATMGVSVNLATGTASGGDAQGDVFVNFENLRGSDFNDDLTGDANVNVIEGGAGEDTLNGGGGDDTLNGGAGGDILIGGAGADILDGGDSEDQVNYLASSAGVTIDLLAGTGLGGDAQGDVLSNIESIGGSNFDDVLTGDDGFNNIMGNAGDDIINGEAGDDLIQGGAGADIMDGGAGIDTLNYSESATSVNVNLATGVGSGGDAAGDVISNFENLTGSFFANDVLTGDANDNVIDGNSGNDRLDGGAGNDTLIGGLGADTLLGGAGADSHDGGAGFDTVDYRGASSSVRFNANTGGTLGDAAGDSYTGIERFYGSDFNDIITGTDANEFFYGEDGNDQINAGGGIDRLFGGDGNDIMRGDAGNDQLYGSAGSDQLNGGTGFDIANYSRANAAVIVNLASGGTGGDAAGDSYFGIEAVYGSDFNDTLTGNNSSNELRGGDGDDILVGGGGNDRLHGEAGADAIDGGTGIDTVIYSTAAAAVALNLITGGTAGDAAGDSFTSIEWVIGSDFDDMITGNAANNRLSGQDGNDVLDGGDGNDRLLGGDGNDTLLGGAGVDTIFGQDGDDTMFGGDSNDFFFGGAGADSHDGGAGLDTVSYLGSASGVIVNIQTGGTGGDAAGDSYVSVERIFGSGHDDTLIGSDGNDTLLGNGGDDYLAGGLGNDSLNGGAGVDSFGYDTTGDGADVISGFTTNEVISILGGDANFDSFAELSAVATDAGANVIFNFGGGNTLTIVGQNLADLDAGNFDFPVLAEPLTDKEIADLAAEMPQDTFDWDESEIGIFDLDALI